MVSIRCLFLFSLILVLIPIEFASAACPPDCEPPSDDGLGGFYDDLFESDPEAAIEETTRLEADGVSSAEARSGGGARIEHADSLTADAGRRFENIDGADVDSDGNVIHADHIEIDDIEFTDVAALDPIGSEARNLRADSAALISGEDFEATTVAGFELADGNLRIGSAENSVIGDVTVYRAEGISRQNGIIKIAKASRIEIGEGVLSEIENFEGTGSSFHVGSAKDIMNGCLLLSGVWDSNLHVTKDSLVIDPASGVVFSISDCGFSQSSFEAFSENSSLEISKTKEASYEISHGKLSCFDGTTTEIIETNATAHVQYGASCMRCVSIDPKSTYWLNSEIYISRDFGVHVPGHGSQFKLCIRKHSSELRQAAAGYVDLVEDSVFLTKTAILLRYPFRHGQPSSLLMNQLFQVVNGFEGSLSSFRNYTRSSFVIGLVNDSVAPNAAAIVNPNNYFTLREQPTLKGIHRLLKTNPKIAASELTDSRVWAYSDSTSDLHIVITGNGLFQQGSRNSIIALPAGHDEISELVN